MTVLHGSGVVLRPFRSEEFELFWKASERWIELTDPDADREAARKQVRQRVAMSGAFTPEGIEFAIETEGRLAGRIQARTNATVMPPTTLEIGVELFDEVDRGRRLGPEAIRLLTAHLFELREAHRVQLTTGLDNAAMRRVAERLGFAFEGVMRGSMPTPDGFTDQALYAITRPDYEKVKATWISTS
ncbi:MAG: GNAT family N-acetyltransferase [Actinomycetota bacterium]|nr:GNAT family N-acetyltransferase [Actinomycetota bacterium]